MSIPTRRGALGVMLGTGIGLGLSPVASVAMGPIALPEGPHLFSRRREHSLIDDVWLIISRSWQVTFLREESGISITGELVSVDIDAPPSLAPITAIERSRSTAEMWPILLNESGLIFAAGDDVSKEDMAAAVAEAERMIAETPIPEHEREAQRNDLAEMQKAGASLLDRFPDDLFYPTIGPMYAVRSVDLPGGMTGEFELSYTATAVPGKGWLDRAERTIVTRLGGTEHIAREYWQLQPI